MKIVCIVDEVELYVDDGIDEEELERCCKEWDVYVLLFVLELFGDLFFVEVKLLENVFFVCKLNFVIGDEDLEFIFGWFGKIFSCEVICD